MEKKSIVLEKLKKNFGQIGGKGTMRRKKIVKKGLNVKKVYLEKIKNFSNLILKTGIQTGLETDKFLNIFHTDLVNKIKKDDLGKTKKKLNGIREELLVFLQKLDFKDGFFQFCDKYLKEGSQNTVARYLENVLEIINEKEYEFYPKTVDKYIYVEDAIKFFKITSLNNITPISIRYLYKRELSEGRDNELARKMYFRVLGIFGDKPITTGVNTPLVLEPLTRPAVNEIEKGTESLSNLDNENTSNKNDKSNDEIQDKPIINIEPEEIPEVDSFEIIDE